MSRCDVDGFWLYEEWLGYFRKASGLSRHPDARAAWDAQPDAVRAAWDAMEYERRMQAWEAEEREP